MRSKKVSIDESKNQVFFIRRKRKEMEEQPKKSEESQIKQRQQQRVDMEMGLVEAMYVPPQTTAKVAEAVVDEWGTYSFQEEKTCKV